MQAFILITSGIISFTIDYKDLLGQLGKQVTTISSGSNVIFDETEPTLTNVTISSDNADPMQANIGDTVTLSFTTIEELLWLPVVTIDGNDADSVNGLDGNSYTATRIMQAGDTEGVIGFTIDFEDLAGNEGSHVTEITSGSNVTFVTN